MRRFTPIELAIGVALGGSLLAVFVPAFAREVSASRFVESTDGLSRMSMSAFAYADTNGGFPESAPLTPALPPRGKKDVDPPGTWDGPTWKTLGFRASPEGVPHAYSFSFESVNRGGAFVAQARGDLDGDGILSTFEMRGDAQPTNGRHEPPHLYVEQELE